MSVSHLWLGLLSSIVVFLACFSGSIYAFKQQITDLVNREGAFLQDRGIQLVNADSVLAAFEDRFGPATSITFYPDEGRSALVSSFSRNDPGVAAYINPHNAEIIDVQSSSLNSFFAFVLDLHRFLLAGDVGKVVNGIAILIFVFMLFSGFILWLPKKIKHMKQGLAIRWKARFYRLNYDLHKVLGFYSLILLFFIAMTGLYVSFHWMKNVIIMSLGGDSIVISDSNLALKKDLSDSFNSLLNEMAEEKKDTITAIWSLRDILDKTNETFPGKGIITVQLPNELTNNVSAVKLSNQNTLRFYVPDVIEFSPSGNIRKTTPFFSLPLHEQFKAVAKPLHTGEIMGLPGIILYFLVSLIGCSLPITGVIIWWKKR